MSLTPEEFLKERLETLVMVFPDIKVRHDNESVDNSHLIEITPNSLFHNLSAYHEAEECLTSEFIDRFPFQNIIFIAADDDDLKIETVFFQTIGVKFEEVKKPSINEHLKIQVGTFENYAVWSLDDNLFESYNPILSSGMIRSSGLHASSSLKCTNDAVKYSGLEYKVHVCLEISKSHGIEDKRRVQFVSVGENNYALSA